MICMEHPLIYTNQCNDMFTNQKHYFKMNISVVRSGIMIYSIYLNIFLILSFFMTFFFAFILVGQTDRNKQQESEVVEREECDW